jgi:hypothetical protein
VVTIASVPLQLVSAFILTLYKLHYYIAVIIDRQELALELLNIIYVYTSVNYISQVKVTA